MTEFIRQPTTNEEIIQHLLKVLPLKYYQKRIYFNDDEQTIQKQILLNDDNRWISTHKKETILDKKDYFQRKLIGK